MIDEHKQKLLTLTFPGNLKQVHIIIDAPNLTEKKLTQTWLTGISGDVVFASSLEHAIETTDQYEYAIISYAGTVYQTPYPPASNIQSIFNIWIERESEHFPCVSMGKKHSPMFVNLSFVRKFGWPTKKQIKKFNSLARELITYKQKSTKRHKQIYTPIYLDYSLPYSTLLGIIQQCGDTKYDVIYAPPIAGLGEFFWYHMGHSKTKLVFLCDNMCSLKWKQAVMGSINMPPDSRFQLERITAVVCQRYGGYVAPTYHKGLVTQKEDSEIWSDERWLDTVKQISDYEIMLFNYLTDSLNVDSTKKNFIYVGEIFYDAIIDTPISFDDAFNQFNYLKQLPNSTVVGSGPLKEAVFHENSSC